MPKQCFIAMACDSKSHTIVIWHVIDTKLNIGKKITGLEIMTLNREKKKNVSKLIELMFKGELLFLQGCVLKSRLVRGMFKLVESVFEHHSC